MQKPEKEQLPLCKYLDETKVKCVDEAKASTPRFTVHAPDAAGTGQSASTS